MTGFNLIDDLGFLLSEYYSIGAEGRPVLTDQEAADAISADIKAIIEKDTTGILDHTYDSYDDFIADWNIFKSTVNMDVLLPSASSSRDQNVPAWFSRVKDFFDTVEDVQIKGEDTLYRVYDDDFQQSRCLYVDVFDETTSLDTVLDMMRSGIEQYLVVYDISESASEAVSGTDDPEEALNLVQESLRIETQDNLVDTAYAVMKQAHGKPYKKPGRSPKEGFDCSNFVHYVYAEEGIDYVFIGANGFSGNALKPDGDFVEVDEPQPGDVIWFPGHVGIITKDDPDDIHFVHSSGTPGAVGSGVHETSLNKETEYQKLSRRYYRHRSLVGD